MGTTLSPVVNEAVFPALQMSGPSSVSMPTLPINQTLTVELSGPFHLNHFCLSRSLCEEHRYSTFQRSKRNRDDPLYLGKFLLEYS